MNDETKEERPGIAFDRSLIRCEGLLPHVGGLEVFYGPLRIEVVPIGLVDGNTLGLYATGLADEEIVRAVEDRIEQEIHAATNELSAHELVRLRAAINAIGT